MRIQAYAGGWIVPANRFDLVPEQPLEPPSITVVIPHFQAQADLDLVLTALTLQTHPASRLQVVIADDGSATPPSVAAAGGLDVRVVEQARAGFRAAAARNLGAAAADGEVLCFLDADTVPASDYLTRAVRLPAVLPDALVVGRRDHADLAGWLPERLTAWFAGEAAPPAALPAPAWLADGYTGSRNLLDADDRSFRFVISAVLTLRAEVFREIGGFTESFTTYGGEDWELAWRAWNAGAVLAHEPTALAFHDGPDWAGRGGASLAKNSETLALARLIPQAQTRGHGLWQPLPEIVVTLAPIPNEVALIACIDSLLAEGDVGLWLDQPLPPGLTDPRVHSGPPPQEVTSRARVRVRVVAPLVCPLGELCLRIGPKGLGRVTVTDDAGPLLVATATRAQLRAERWVGGVVGRDLVTELFGAQDLVAADIGARRLPPDPDLAALWGGY